MKRGLTGFNIAALVVGFGFLYLPIVLLVIYSFNASRLVTVWGGFSTRWYGSLFRNEQLLDAIWVTFTTGNRASMARSVCVWITSKPQACARPFHGEPVQRASSHCGDWART